MASYQTRHRDPLIDPETHAVIERRGREVLGLALGLAALVFAAALWSYSPEDPGWMAETAAPLRNWLGWFGAGLASTLIIIIGKGAWSLPVILAAWSYRFLRHRGEERAMGRLSFAVIAVALTAVFAATFVPGAAWGHAFGLGGLFGDTVLGALLGILPLPPGAGLVLLALVLGAASLFMLGFVAGLTKLETQEMALRAWLGLLWLYGHVLQLAAQGGARARALASDLSAEPEALAPPPPFAGQSPRLHAAPPLAAPLTAAPPGPRREPLLRATPPLHAPRPLVQRPAPELEPLFEAPLEAPAEKRGLLARMQGLTRRRVEGEGAALTPELVTPAMPEAALHTAAPDADRIRARIAAAVQAKAQAPTPAAPPSPLEAALAARREPSLTRPVAPAPLIASAAPTAAPAWDLPEEAGEEAAEEEDWGLLADALAPEPLPPRAGVYERRAVVQHNAPKPAPLSRQAKAEAEPRLQLEAAQGPEYELPPLSLLASPTLIQRHVLPDEALEENARMLESVLDDYGVKGEIVSVRPGPVVTMYELEPAPGLKASRVIGLSDDIARSMSALSARVSTVPGRTVIGIELPNAMREKVVLREILSAREFGDSNLRLPLALGKDIGGEPIIANLAKMPHLLIAGTTGSGKSVAINTMILSLLYKLTPEECRLIMIDPKMLELSVYDGIPHLLSPVVTDPKKAVVALKWVVGEMEERYRKMSKMGVRNIEGYNGRVREALDQGEMFKRTVQTGFDEDTGEPVFETEEFAPVPLPYIVVIVDEMADLMMVAGKEIEACIQRLAQMARASGIHLIMATQRPSVDVITGTIKANFPTRISFQVTSKIDSRTILGEQGAEQLLGMGDMLYMAGGARITRVHGPFVSDEEVEEVVTYLKSFGPPAYVGNVVEGPDEDQASDIDLVLGLGGGEEGDEVLYDQAVAIVAKDRKCSTSYIQRKLGIGYNKAARLVEQMEEAGLITPANHVGKREILIPER